MIGTLDPFNGVESSSQAIRDGKLLCPMHSNKQTTGLTFRTISTVPGVILGATSSELKCVHCVNERAVLTRYGSDDIVWLRSGKG